MHLSRAFKIATVCLGLFPILKLNHFSILMIVWFVFAIVQAFKNKAIGNIMQHWKIFLPLSFCFLIYVVFLPFATDLNELTKQLVKSLPFLIFPLGFLLNVNAINKKVVSALLNVFTCAVVILNSLGWVKILESGFSIAFEQNNFYNPVFRSYFSDATHLHLPYLGLFSTFACLYLVYNQLKSKQLHVFKVFAVIGLLASMYIYSARMALACFLIASCFILVNSIKSNLIKIAVIFVLPILSLLFFLISPLKERYISTFETEMVLPHKGQLPHEVNYRYGIWYCAFQNIKEFPLFGVNPDQAQKKLNECYQQFSYESYEDFTKVTYNTHSQYLDQVLKFGIVGFVFFVFCFVSFLNKASFFYKVFILVIGLSFLTENFLDRQMGVVFVALFNTLFVVYNLNEREKSFSSRLVR